ncbi:MAG TPA: o-succinylbenzoate synthase [Candidatus Acidoferrales bacterium]
MDCWHLSRPLMRINSLTLRELRVPLLSFFETSFGRTTQRRIFLVEADVNGVPGWAEVTAGENPFYNPETIDTSWLVIEQFAWPAVKGREFSAAAEVAASLAHIRGHRMARAAIENACWDAEAKGKGIPLWKLIGGTRSAIPCGVSIGIQDTIEILLAKIEEELSAGYQRMKIKIKPGWDVQTVALVRERFPHIKLMVDANAAYQLSDAEHIKRLDDYFLMMIEQPLAWDDIYDHARLQKQLQTPICLDESIENVGHARAAIELGACQIINIKLGRVGGFTSARAIHDLCQERGIPVWCGGMLESGIGRAHNIALATLPNFRLPGDTSASRRYWAEDVIDPEVEVTPQGVILVPIGPGIGFQPRLDRIEKLTVRKEVLR